MVVDVASGLWLWRLDHPDWAPHVAWQPPVTSTVAETGGEVVLIDPLAPPDGHDAWARLDARPPTVVAILKPDHVRDVTLFSHWYDIPAHGPWLYWKGDAPLIDLQPILPDEVLPGGLVALFDARGGIERPLYLPEQKAIVFADGMTAPGGVLRVWWTPVLERRVLPALRAMLELPFELVLVSHGEPVHSRADFEAALERDAWSIPDA